MGENNGQGMKVQSRSVWDEDTDDVAYVSFKNEAIFVIVIAFAVYLYWYPWINNLEDTRPYTDTSTLDNK